MLIISYPYMQIVLLQQQRIHHVVTKKLKNVVRMKGIVIMTVIAKQVSCVALIIAQVVSHHTLTAAVKHQVLYIIHHELDPMSNVITITMFFLHSLTL